MKQSFSFFGGIDFSGAREPLSNLWSAVGAERDSKLHIMALRPHAFREDLASYVSGGWRAEVGGEGEKILWGADFPFGLPAAAAARIAGDGAPSWSAVAAWIADRPADEVREHLADFAKASRQADTGSAMNPLDLRLYKQTVEGIRWLHELRDAAEVSILPQAPRSGSENAIIEVYPSGTARDLGFKWGRAPRRPGEVRARAAALRTFLSFANPSIEATATALEDAWDATLACLTAWLARDDLDQPFRARDGSREEMELEGWIYRPPAALS